jgi:phosphotransferase system HPr (HPr) family protein
MIWSKAVLRRIILIERTVNIGSSFETRSAALLVQTASKFSSKINIKADERTANAKSIMGIISLGITAGQTIQLTAEGDDEKQAVPALEQFFQVSK